MSSLADCEKKFLLELARRAIVAAVEHQEARTFNFFKTASSVFKASPELEPASNRLQAPAGAFVTLHRGSRLRGCIGQLAGRESLVNVVAYCAKAAALEDPRFAPLTRPELFDMDIEISVLSPVEDITPADIVSGKHGLIVTRGSNRGVLLPQVASQLQWNSERFLEETCAKAGLERSAWKDPNTRIQAFTAEIFSESRLNVPETPKPGYSIST